VVSAADLSEVIVWKLEVEALERDRGAAALRAEVCDAPLFASILDTDDLVEADRTAWGAV
jgi:hypothetical protein